MRRRVEPELERVQRRPELSLSPGEILAERAGREVAGLLERTGEGHAAGRVREATPPHRVGLHQGGAVERDAASHEAKPVDAPHDVDAAIHRFEARVLIAAGGCCTGARRRYG